MLIIKMKHPLYSVLIVFCVSHAFDKFGVTSDSSASLGLGLDVGRFLDPSTNVGLVDDTSPWTSSRREQNRRTASEATDNVQNSSSELNDLFAVGSGRPNASITSSSKTKLVKLEGGSSVITDQIKTNVPGVFNLSLSGSNTAKPRPTPSIGLGLPPTNSNISSIVPSEGGVLREELSHTSTTKSSSLEMNLSTTINIDVNSGKDTKVGLGLSLGLPTREGVSSLVNKQLESQDSHTISARKGATLPEQTGSANGTIVPLTFTSSEFLNPNSSHQFSSDMNNNNRTTVSVSTSTTTYSSRPTGNPTDIVKHINTSKASRPSLQNGRPSTITEMTEKTGTQSVNSESLITPTSSKPPIEAVASKNEPTSDIAATNSNSALNETRPTPIIDLKNITLDKPVIDKSGIIASYPPLKKRPKPLKTTDLNSGNSSPITPEHSSSEHDYVIPIVVTILTVPMLVVLVLFLYKKGSEFWERRHYRRMDFLIDGMYND